MRVYLLNRMAMEKVSIWLGFMLILGILVENDGGFNDGGFNDDGVNGGGFSDGGFNDDGVNDGGVNEDGINNDGVNNGGVNKGGFNDDGFRDAGVNNDGVDNEGVNNDGINNDGVNNGGANDGGFNNDGFCDAGVNNSGVNEGGFNNDGFRDAGVNNDGVNNDGINNDGVNNGAVNDGGFNDDGFGDARVNDDGLNDGGFNNEFDGEGNCGSDGDGRNDGDGGIDGGSDGDGDGGSDGESDGESNHSPIEEQLIELLVELLDNEGDWTWGCKTKQFGYIQHDGDQGVLPGQQRVGPREWSQNRLQFLNANDGALLPDHLKHDVLPQETGGTLPYQEVSDNIKKQARLPFGHSERKEWLSTHGPAFHKMMTGDYGNGIQHLQFDIGEVWEQMDCDQRKRHLFQSNDIDSGMGWLPTLGAIKTDLRLFPYPLSSRNFDANIHLFTDINQKRVKINDINHFLLGEFGNIGGKSCQLFLFLPSLYDPKSTGNGVKDHLKDAFISRCFIPAAEEILGDMLLEQFGVGMRENKTDCEAPMYESQIYGSAGRRLAGDVHIPQRFLARVWESCMMKVYDQLRRGDQDLMVFKTCRLLWSFKGLKYALSGVNDEELREIMESKVFVLP